MALDDDYWTVGDVALYCGVEPDTISSYRSRGQMPDADRVLGRTPLWRPSTITEWRPTLPDTETARRTERQRPRQGDDPGV